MLNPPTKLVFDNYRLYYSQERDKWLMLSRKDNCRKRCVGELCARHNYQLNHPSNQSSNPSEFTMSDSFGAVLSGLGSNLVFQTTKMLADFDPKKGFITDFEINLNENVTGSDDWTMYIAFKYDYKPGDNKRIKINFDNGSSFDFPWVKLESGKLFLDYDLDVYSKQIRDAYIGEYLNLCFVKIGNQFRIAICDNTVSIDRTFSGFNINTSKLQISTDYYIQRIGFSKSVYPINDKVYHKIQFLDKAKGVFFV